MKKNILLLLIFFFLGTFLTEAQFKRGSEKIRSYKIAYLTEKLNLTENEAERFWPIYNNYNKKRRVLRKEEHRIFKEKKYTNVNINSISEKDAEETLERIKAIKKNQYEIKIEFHNKISKILSFKKILVLQISEHEFNRKLIKKLRNNHKKRS